MVEDGGHGETNKGPDTTEEANVTPAAVGSDELSPENGWAERKDGENKHRDVGASLSGGSQLRGYSQCSEFIDASANTRNGHASDEYVHAMRSRCNNVAHNEQRSSTESNITPAEQI